MLFYAGNIYREVRSFSCGRKQEVKEVTTFLRPSGMILEKHFKRFRQMLSCLKSVTGGVSKKEVGGCRIEINRFQACV
jgi:hypothetical protein